MLFLPGGLSLAFLTLLTPAQCLPAVTSSHPLLKVYNSTRIAGKIWNRRDEQDANNTKYSINPVLIGVKRNYDLFFVSPV